MHRRGYWIRIIYALCLIGATATHWHSIMSRGWLPSAVPIGTQLFWDGLAFLDPLAILLLFVRPRAGIGLTVAIIVSDVAHNLWFRASHPLGRSFPVDVATDLFMMSQIAFLLFVAANAPAAWRSAEMPDPAT